MVTNKAIIVAGVSGCGKSTIGHALASQIGWSFVEADEFHSQAAKAKMIARKPLDNTDRAPWLSALNSEMLERAPAVLACSALKQTYRDRLSKNLVTRIIWIRSSRALAEQRISGRPGHFMPASLVTSQFEAAEVPLEAIFLSATDSVEASIDRCLKALGTFAARE